MSEKREIVIKLTDEQRQQIKDATGKELTEPKVGLFDSGNPLEDRANPFAMVEERANPFAMVEERANPFAAIEDRA